MANPLMNVPGLGGFITAQQQNEQAGLGNLQKMQAVLGLQGAMQEQARRQKLEQAVAQSGGDVKSAMEALIKSGDVAGAAKLAPLVNAGKPKEFAPPEVVAVQRYLDMLPAGDPRRKPLEARLEHLTTKQQPATTLSPLGKLIAERDSLPAGHQMRTVYDQAIQNYKPGGVNVDITNAPNALPLGKPAANKVDEGLLDAGVRQQRLSAIEKQFKPEYQQYAPRLSAGWASLKEKMGVDIAPEDKQFLAEFSAYKRNAINSLNEYIKSITGAAMSEAEAARILRGMPNPGQGMFDGDSPTEFKAKLDDAIKQTRMAEARLVYIKRKGLQIGDVPLDQMPSLMNQRGRELEGLIKKQNSKLTDGDVRKLVKRNLAQEFGLIE